MRYLTIGAIVCACVSIGSTVQAQTADPQVMAPITRFMEAFNKGDTAGAAATHAADADLVIIDEVAPYLGAVRRRSRPGRPIWNATTKKTASAIRRCRSAPSNGSSPMARRHT